MAKAERAKIVDAQNMVSVTVSVEHGIKFANARADGLLAKIGSGIDEHTLSTILDEYRRPGTAVVRIGRMTHGAVAADGGYAHRRAAAQHR